MAKVSSVPLTDAIVPEEHRRATNLRVSRVGQLQSIGIDALCQTAVGDVAAAITRWAWDRVESTLRALTILPAGGS